jgi:hypothetical protein
MLLPTTYSRWNLLLDQFGDGDDTVLEEMSRAGFSIDAGTAARFYWIVEAAYKKRKQHWIEKFQHSFQFQHFKTEDDFGIALRNGQQNLSPLSRFVLLKGLPDDLRSTLHKDLESFVAEIKQSLKDNVSKISGGREKILLLLKSFGLADITKENLPEKNTSRHNNPEIIPPTGRKIIF